MENQYLKEYEEKPVVITDEKLLKRLETHLDRISVPAIKTFVELVCKREHSNKTLAIALNATDMLVAFMKARALYIEIRPNKQTDTAIAATLLHNVFFDRTLYVNKQDIPWQDVFKARINLSKLAEAIMGTDYHYDGYMDYIFQIIEAQLGEDMPIIACRPVNGQITYIVWENLWIYYTYEYARIKANAKCL